MSWSRSCGSSWQQSEIENPKSEIPTFGRSRIISVIMAGIIIACFPALELQVYLVVMKTLLFLIIICFLSIIRVFSQDPWPIVSEAIVDEHGDTIAVITLPEFVKFAPPEFKNAFQERRYNRLVRNVKKAYPYAKLAGIRLIEYENQLAQVTTERERIELMRQAEDDIREEFEDDLKKLTFSQGWILLKLIDRETGNTSYTLVSEFRGKFRAFFWQAFARIFGFDLKVQYDPLDVDKDIEQIVRMIEAGAI